MAEKDQTKNTQIAKIPTGPRGIVLSNLDDMLRFAEGVVASRLAPKSFDTSAKIVIAIQTGLELGIEPMQALQGLHVINGKVGLSGDMAVALIQASGKAPVFRRGYDGAEGTDEYKAIVESQRPGSAEVDRTEFSIADAKTAGLWGKTGPWTQYWKRMLMYRAIGFHARDYYSDVTKGMVVSEELQDYPAPVCKTPKRGDRKPVENTNKSSPSSAGSESASTEAGSDGPVVDEATIRAMVDGCTNSLREILCRATSEIAVQPDYLVSLFKKLYALVNGCDEDNLTTPKNFSIAGLTAVNKQLEDGLPQEITDAFEPEPDKGIPIEEAEENAKEKFGTYYRYKCDSQKCNHVFNEPGANDNCPKCFAKKITDNGPGPDGESEAK